MAQDTLLSFTTRGGQHRDSSGRVNKPRAELPELPAESTCFFHLPYRDTGSLPRPLMYYDSHPSIFIQKCHEEVDGLLRLQGEEVLLFAQSFFFFFFAFKFTESFLSYAEHIFADRIDAWMDGWMDEYTIIYKYSYMLYNLKYTLHDFDYL